MIRLLYCLGFLLYANVTFTQASVTSVTIQHLLLDSTLNVRALEVNDGSIYFASSDSRVMVLKESTTNFKEVWPRDTLNNPHYRSLAITENGVFAMAIASPALLYKNGKIVYTEKDSSAFYDAMEFWNDQEGIAMGDPTEACISVIITRDGGDTWEKLPCDKLPEGRDGEAAFAASDTNIKTLGNETWIASGGISSRIFYSPDKGMSWSVYETPVVQGKPTTGMYSVDFYDRKNGFAIGGDYTAAKDKQANKLKTSDGGKTWSLVAQGQNPDYRSCVQYVPGSSGKQLVAIGFNGIDVSNDGGDNWQHISDEGYYTLRFIDQNSAVAAGANRISLLHFD